MFLRLLLCFIKIFLLKMKAVLAVILCFIQSVARGDSCFTGNFSGAVENAFISCSSNTSCEAKCYSGYIFSSGSTDESYSCQSGEWMPMLSTCKRIPIAYITYSNIWEINNVIPLRCDSVSQRLEESTENLEEMFTNICKDLFINSTVKFSYSMIAFRVTANLTTVYHNFSNSDILEICISKTYLSTSLLRTLDDMFEGVTCNESMLEYTVWKSLFVNDRYKYCSDDTVIYNVTTDDNGKYELYCDFEMTGTPPRMITTATAIMVTMQKNVTSETDVRFNVTDDFEKPTTFEVQLFEGGLDLISKIYIVGAAGGISLIFVLIILVVCLKKSRFNAAKGPGDKVKTDRIKNVGKDSSFKGELIENELYLSADNELDCKSVNGNSHGNLEETYTVPRFNEKTPIQLEFDDQYSYPSK